MFRKLALTTCTIALCGFFAGAASAGEEENDSPNLYAFKGIPKAWIGVRIDQTPCELKAHLKRGELMLVNIAKDSPADQAGLDRFDVVLSFNEKEITDMESLLKAIQENGADKPASMTVIHAGAERTVQITPLMLDSMEGLTYKYEEEQVVETAPVEKYFGHSAKVGPDGVLLFTPQGRLDQMPDDIKSMLEDLPRDIEDFSYYQDFDLGSDSESSQNATTTRHTTVTVQVQENGGQLTISRDAAGVFTVERGEADETQTKVYENKAKLREGDPEAYKLFQRSSGASTYVLPPDWENLTLRQRQFQKELLDKLKRAEERAKIAERKKESGE